MDCTYYYHSKIGYFKIKIENDVLIELDKVEEKQKNKREKYKNNRDFFCFGDVVLFAYGKRFFVLSVHIDKIMQKKQ